MRAVRGALKSPRETASAALLESGVMAIPHTPHQETAVLELHGANCLSGSSPARHLGFLGGWAHPNPNA